MKDMICLLLCGIRDSFLVKEIYLKLLNLDIIKIILGMVSYYDDFFYV